MAKDERIRELADDRGITGTGHQQESAGAAEPLGQRTGQHHVVRQPTTEVVERVPAPAGTVDGDAVRVVHVEVPAGRAQATRQLRNSGQAGHRLYAVDQHDRRTSCGLTLPGLIGDGRLRRAQPGHRAELLEYAAQDLHRGVGTAVDEEVRLPVY